MTTSSSDADTDTIAHWRAMRPEYRAWYAEVARINGGTPGEAYARFGGRYLPTVEDEKAGREFAACYGTLGREG